MALSLSELLQIKGNKLCYSFTGIECLHCTNVVLNKSSIPENVRIILTKFEATFKTPECVGAHSSSSTTSVTLKNCTDATNIGKIQRCGKLMGNLRMSGDSQLTGSFGNWIKKKIKTRTNIIKTINIIKSMFVEGIVEKG